MLFHMADIYHFVLLFVKSIRSVLNHLLKIMNNAFSYADQRVLQALLTKLTHLCHILKDGA